MPPPGLPNRKRRRPPGIQLPPSPAAARAPRVARPMRRRGANLRTCEPRSINHRREGLCSQVVEVVLPPERPARERWLTRSEAARLVLAAWRYREIQKGKPTDRRSRQHVAKFVLVALYTGTRASAVCGAALEPTVGRGWIDVEPGVFYRRPAGLRETKKRQPPVPLPPGLLAHLRRWKKHGQRFAVEWNRGPVADIGKAFGNTVANAGPGPDVMPHVLRHTAATWLMQAGVDMWEAAGFLGMTVEMLSQRYSHHHPALLERAKNAFSQHRHSRGHTLASTVEQTSSNCGVSLRSNLLAQIGFGDRATLGCVV
jgi:integrase